MKTHLTRAGLLCAGLLALAPAARADAPELTIYKQPGFAGEQLTLNGYTRDLAQRGFADQASSLVVSSGRWQVCTQPDLKGDCVVLGRGEYPALDPRLNHRIESARALASYGDESGFYYRPASIDFFEGPGFRGRTLRVDRDVLSFDARASSLVVNEGRWQMCTDPGYEGMCRVFGPGRYARLQAPVGSLRRVG